MAARLLMAVAMRCTSPEVCPDEEAIKAAIQLLDDQFVVDRTAQHYRNNPGTIVFIHVPPVDRVHDIECGSSTGSSVAAACKFSFDRKNYRYEAMAEVTLEEGEWVINNMLTIQRRRR